jgi:hypothetical protein
VAYQHRPRQFEVHRSSSGSRTTSLTSSLTPTSSPDSDDGYQVVRTKRLRTKPPTQSSQTQASEAPARRGRPPLGAIERVTVQSRDITQMFSQGSRDPFTPTQDTQIPNSQQ